MPANTSRRNFLTAAAALAVTGPRLLAQTEVQPANPVAFQLFPAAVLAADALKLHAAPGNNNLFANPGLPFTVVMTTETNHSAKEFEFHAGRDHILQIIDGTTVYQVGGTPQNARNTKPSEWLAPDSKDATTITLQKGDMLIIPRGTPHKRSTDATVTFFLISTT
jgi:mannose-6-phosphate isomerase-like protein (cupin superfamily)